MIFLFYFIFSYLWGHLSLQSYFNQPFSFSKEQVVEEQQKVRNYIDSIYEDYVQRIKNLSVSEETKKKLNDELKRLAFANWSDSEATEIRKYLNTILDLPWNKTEPSKNDLIAAREILDEDHFGMNEVKERILDYIAVRAKVGQGKAPILCLVGPPGVGKTSISKSIARALNKKFDRISLGGVHDETVFRGSPRFYIGSKMGRIMEVIRKLKTSDPVILLDEIDKLSTTHGWAGDPSAALLEVLDPEQNKNFQDNYIDLPYDLSKVTFITTANNLSNIPRALRDRLDIIEIESYSPKEKIQIVQRSLLPKELEKKGIKKSQLTLSDEVISQIILSYTQESGVRELERQIEKICRKMLRHHMENPLITVKNLSEYLGPPKYFQNSHDHKSLVGSIMGCYWSEIGGGIQPIEAALLPGQGNIIMSGNLGNMTLESMKAAVTYVKSRAKEWNIPEQKIKNQDLHLHFSNIGIPKDGPSAGLAVACLTYSILTNTPLLQDVTVSGELSLRGQVLIVGGIKGKLTAAKQQGMRKIILPRACMNEAAKISDDDKIGIEIIYVDTFDEALIHLVDQQKI